MSNDQDLTAELLAPSQILFRYRMGGLVRFVFLAGVTSKTEWNELTQACKTDNHCVIEWRQRR